MKKVDISSLDLVDLTNRCFAGYKTSILKEISGGHSGAAVFLIDIAEASAGAKTATTLLPGQYILKVQAQNPWPGEAQESARHSEAMQRSSEFGTSHLPALQYSNSIDNLLFLLYDVAGQSLASFVAADTVDGAALRHYCATVATDLWSQWNDKYIINTSTSARASLQRWLDYRLNSGKAPQLHTFVKNECEGKSVFRMADRVLINPLFAATSEYIDVPVASVSFDGMIHGDLHLGNILVDRTMKLKDQYWLIDFALAIAAPLGFDQAYLEMSIMINLLQGVEPQRILNILDALDSTDDPAYASRVPVSDVGVLDVCRGIRQANSTWQASSEPKRPDSVAAQCLLSRLAVGINWANKPLQESKRRLALAYAAWAATRYLERFNANAFTSLLTEQGQQFLPPTVTPAWPEVWEQLGRFDNTKAKYVLITDRLNASRELQSLALIPWSAIVDLDPSSNEQGLYSTIGKMLATQRSVRQYGLKSIPTDTDYGTAWFMAYGWPSRYEPVPLDFRRWRSEYGEPYRRLFRELRRVAAPLPVKVLILASAELDSRLLQSLIDMADESLEASSDITLIGPTVPINDPAIKARYPIEAFEFIRGIYQVFGASIQVDEPAIPSTEGLVGIPIDHLRSLEEDFDILHSNILMQLPRADHETDAFWRGNPPNWLDLHADVDVRRAIGPDLLRKVSGLLQARGNYTVELRHAPGAGGTTAALRCGWDLRRDFPVTVLRQYSATTADRVDQLFHLSQKPVLLIAEAAVLPPASREELYREIAKRNARCVILYVVRTFGDESSSAPRFNPPTDRLEITDPMNDNEVADFLRAFSARTTSTKRQRLLHALAESEEWRPYRNPFFFGLTTYEEEFESVQSYVEHHLASVLMEPVKKVVHFLALVTRYSQTGISTGLLNRYLGLDPASDIDITEALGSIVARLTVRRGPVVRLLHPVIAQEVLRQSLGGKDWNYGLKDLCLEFIARTVEHLGSDAEETRHLFSELFIRRDYWTPSVRRRRNFSELILDIPVPAGQHQVLLALTDTCPEESHFWNHLGRHHIYEMKQNFAEAEQHLTKAIELDQSEQVHHHSLGMVRRFWIRSLMADMLRQDPAPTAEQMLRTINALFVSAAEEFATARSLGPEDNHGYITHIQLILEILETLIRLDSEHNFGSILKKTDEVGEWVRGAIVVAEDLLRGVRHLRAQDKPSRYEITCTTGLAALYGNFDDVISSLENLVKSFKDPDIRRALATAYYSKSKRIWANIPISELRNTKDLMEENLKADPTNEHDIRAWFQAFRRLPEFSYIDAIDRLEGWARSSNQVDAFYYLYILHFLRWRQGTERDESAMRVNLDQCTKRSIGKRGLSYEWLSKEPAWCPLAHSSELGEWKEYWEHPERLEWVTGSISSIKPQAGTIRLGPQTLAYFVPGTKFSETRHLNSLVKCHIGFSYEGLRAWSVDFLTEDPDVTIRDRAEILRDAGNPAQLEIKIKEVSNLSSIDSTSIGTADSKALARTVERFIQDQLAVSTNLKKPLYSSYLGIRLLEKFGRPPVYERLGFKALRDFLLSMPSIDLKQESNTDIVVKRLSGE